jgi:malonyl CoA-acyl carrier protein transacylase
MTHRESRCRAKIAVFVVPVLVITPVTMTMSRDPVFESVTKNGALIEDDARETPENWLTSSVQWFLIGG